MLVSGTFAFSLRKEAPLSLCLTLVVRSKGSAHILDLVSTSIFWSHCPLQSLFRTREGIANGQTVHMKP